MTRITEPSVAQGVSWNIGTTCIKCLCHIMSPLKRDTANYLTQLYGQNTVHDTNTRGNKKGIPYVEKFF